MSHRQQYVTGLLALGLALGCASTRRSSRTPIGSNHAPYSAKPEYLGTPALPDPSVLQPPMRQGMPVRATPLHAATPEPVEPAEPTQAETEQAAPAEQEAPQPEGSLTVAPSNEGPALNRAEEPPSQWQPQPINIPNGPHP